MTDIKYNPMADLNRFMRENHPWYLSTGQKTRLVDLSTNQLYVELLRLWNTRMPASAKMGSYHYVTPVDGNEVYIKKSFKYMPQEISVRDDLDYHHLLVTQQMAKYLATHTMSAEKQNIILEGLKSWLASKTTA